MKCVMGLGMVLALAGTVGLASTAAAQDDRTLFYGSRVGPNNWSIETVGVGGFHISLKIDSQDVPHIAYGTSAFAEFVGDDLVGHNTLRYSTKPAGDWLTTVVDTQTHGTGNNASLALVNDLPAIAYNDQTEPAEYRMRYAAFDGTNWNKAAVSPIGYSPALAFSGTDPQIATATGNFNLGVATFDGSNWSIASIDTGGPGSRHGIDYQIDGTKHGIAYLQNGVGLKYAENTGSGWSVTTIDTFSSGNRASLAFNAAGNPIIAYTASGLDPGLFLAEFDGSSWSVTEVSDGQHVQPSLAIDPVTGAYHVAYYDQLNSELFYGFNSGSGWEFELVAEDLEHAGIFPSLALDSMGNAHIAFDPPTGVPEPAGVILCLVGAAGIAAMRWRMRVAANCLHAHSARA